MELDVAPLPGNVVWLRNLQEIHQLWGKDAKTVYRAVRHGRLRAYGRPGHQKYYSDSELTALFGEPSNPKPPAGHQNGDNALKGGQQQGFEFTAGDVAA